MYGSITMYSRLPPELKLHIFSFLNRKELGCLASVSKPEKVISETDDLWVDEVISKELIQKTALSAKELSKYVSLLKLNGNYIAHLLQDQASLAGINEQLNRRFSVPVNSPYQLTIITSPSGTLRNLCKAYKKEGSLGLWGTLKKLNSLDVSQGYIPALNLVCHHVDTYFDTLFHDYAITTYSGPRNSQNALAHSACVIIFSNDTKEINQICSEIQDLVGDEPMPFVFIGRSEKSKLIDVNTIDFDIADILDMDVYNSNMHPISFWQLVRDRLTTLSNMSATLNRREEKQCIMM